MRHDDGGNVRSGQPFAQKRPDERRGLDIERRHRFVQEEYLRFGGEGTGDGNTLLLAPGQFSRLPRTEPGESHILQ